MQNKGSQIPPSKKPPIKKRRKKKNNILIYAILYLFMFIVIFTLTYMVFYTVDTIKNRINDAEETNAEDTSETFDTSDTEKLPNTDQTTLPPETTAPLPPEEKVYTYEFKADLSKYEMYMEPENRDEYIILINKEHRLDATYAPDDLVDVTDTRKDRAPEKLRLYPAKALEALFIEMRECGYTDVSVTSAYRDYNKQNYLFTNRVALYSNLPKEEAEAIASTVVARPGTSEHQSGLCLDMHNLPSADKVFAQKEAAAWLKENSYKFGFILRYPEDKIEITEIDFEPWHFRYVGRYHASRMYELGLCLEEYHELLATETND